jgi:hypothetical protein
MSVLQEWQKTQSSMGKILNKYSTSEKSKMNDIIFKKTKEIMSEQSFSLIYDEYGNQLYEKTSDVNNYIVCQKSGFGINLRKDDSKLIEIDTNTGNFKSDFIAYGSFPELNKQNLKDNLDVMSDLSGKNDYLYKTQKQKVRKDDVIQEGINKIKNWFNTDCQKEFRKIDKTFSNLI